MIADLSPADYLPEHLHDGSSLLMPGRGWPGRRRNVQVTEAFPPRRRQRHIQQAGQSFEEGVTIAADAS